MVTTVWVFIPECEVSSPFDLTCEGSALYVGKSPPSSRDLAIISMTFVEPNSSGMNPQTAHKDLGCHDTLVYNSYICKHVHKNAVFQAFIFIMLTILGNSDVSVIYTVAPLLGSLPLTCGGRFGWILGCSKYQTYIDWMHMLFVMIFLIQVAYE